MKGMSIKVYRYKGITDNPPLPTIYTFRPYTFIPLYLILFLISCSNDKKINEDKFVKIYTDLVIAHDTMQTNATALDSLKQKILKKYEVTPGQYNYTVDYYNKDIERWEKFFNKATAYIDSLGSKNRTKPFKKEDSNIPHKLGLIKGK